MSSIFLAPQLHIIYTRKNSSFSHKTLGFKSFGSTPDVESEELEAGGPPNRPFTGGLFPMHGDRGMSSQPAAGNEDKASEDVQEDNASLQVTVPDAIPTVPQPSRAMERQLAIASPRWEPDDLNGG